MEHTKIFLTGGTGFIGSNLIHFLAKNNYRIGILIRSDSLKNRFDPDRVAKYYYDGTLESIQKALIAFNPDVVVHLATLYKTIHGKDDLDSMIESNIALGTKLLEAMIQCQKYELINVGTLFQNYKNESYYPVNLYSAMKQAFFDIVRFYSETSSLKVINLKFSDTYGSNDPRPKILNLLINAAMNGITLDMSPGHQYVDLVYIDDVVRAFPIAMDRLNKMPSGSNECYSIKSVHPIKLRELVSVVSKVCGKDIRVNWGNKKYRKMEIMEPITCIETLPEWSQKIFLEEGVRKVINSSNGVL
jgi:CDP-paratose synthetase